MTPFISRYVAFFLTTCLFLCSALNAQQGGKAYNKKLADSLGADEYGMKAFALVILKTGTRQIEDKKMVDSLFKGHMENINRLAKEGKLIVAGPLGKNEKNYRGIFILDVKTAEDAKALLQSDPTIKAGILDADIFKWYGSAALPMYLSFHEKIEKTRP